MTRALRRIAARTDASGPKEVRWASRLLGSKLVSTITPRALWVAGSYARGALECGDLDLIADVAVEGPYPPDRAVRSALVGSAPDTSLYVGTPDENSSGIAFPEARLVWSIDKPDWESNLATIVADPKAGRYRRPLDALPFRPDQLATDLTELESAIRQREKGVYTWDYIPAESVPPVPDDREQPWPFRFVGRRTAEALRLADAYLSSLDAHGEWVRTEYPLHPLRFSYHGTLVLPGRPELPLDELERVSPARLALVPHISRRGPNGIWLISRGSAHPIEQMFVGVTANLLHCDGRLDYATMSMHATFLDLYVRRRTASAHARRNAREVGGNWEVVTYSDAALLSAVSRCDVLFVWENVELCDSIALTERGGRADEDAEKVATAVEVASALKVRAQST